MQLDEVWFRVVFGLSSLVGGLLAGDRPGARLGRGLVRLLGEDLHLADGVEAGLPGGAGGARGAVHLGGEGG